MRSQRSSHTHLLAAQVDTQANDNADSKHKPTLQLDGRERSTCP